MIFKTWTVSLIGLMIMGMYQPSLANNVQITNVSITGTTLDFEVSWENSWRVNSTAPFNYDAVWVFVKFRDCAQLQWEHALIDSAGAASPLRADTVNDAMGILVYRSADGVGNVGATDVSARLSNLPSGNLEFKVFGVEMVYVPQGSFILGDGLSAQTFRRGSVTATPYQVTSENAITFASSGGNLYATGNISTGTLPAAFPKGYDDFYCMKYEISQQQYAEFLNTLSSAQAASRYLVTTAGRYTLTGAWPVITTTAGNRAMNYMNYSDFYAYLDWSGLRPMTELEYEKACRGPAVQVPGEYAWGTTLITDANTPTNDGTATESVSNAIPAGSGIANYNNNFVIGVLRCGFNGSGASNRLTLGATYYGICEMSGNVRERLVYAGTNAGRVFVPNHGDGYLDPVGTFTVAGWPANAGTGTRGGSYIDVAARLSISDRNIAVFNNNTRYAYMGGRGVRTAP